MLKKLFTFLLVMLVALQPIVSQAGDLGDAFSSLVGNGAVSYSQGGHYTSGARNIFVGGGVEVRFPTSRTNLVSITPPSFSAGCNGISAHFGGFSFINGAQIEQLVKNIAANAKGLVINMVIKALCPMCEAVIQNMQHLAQFAAKANMDSCRIATNLVNQLQAATIGTSGSGTDALTGACASQGSALNSGTDWYTTNMDVCKDLSTSVSQLQGWWSSFEGGVYGTNAQPAGMGGDSTGANGGSGTGTPQSTAHERCTLKIGNCSYLVLKQIFPEASVTANNLTDDNVKKRMLLMNLMGTEIFGNGASCGNIDTEDGGADSGVSTITTIPSSTPASGATSSTVVPQHYLCLPKIDPQQVVGLFMCGNVLTGAADTNDIWSNYCLSIFKQSADTSASTFSSMLSGMKLMDCDILQGSTTTTTSSTNAYDQCETLKASDALTMGLVSGPGFLQQVQSLLQTAVSRVRSNIPMANDDTGRQIIALINLAPYPLYQAINAAAVYPDAGQELVDNMSLLVADHLAYAYFQQFLTMSATASFNGVTIAPQEVDRLSKGMNSLRMEADANRARMGKTIATQQLVMEEIRKVNNVIQQSVMSDQMLNQQKYANTITTSAATVSSSGK